MILLPDRPTLDESSPGPARTLLAPYLVAGVLCLIAEFVLFNLRGADFRVPFYYTVGADQLSNLLLVKNLVETGSYQVYPRVGAPGILDLHDFSTFETVHYLLLHAIANVTREPGVAFNLFFLFSFLLITWTSLFVMGRLGIGAPVAVVASILFSFAPYHFMRGQMHTFLGNYFAIPPLVLLLLRLCEGRPVFVGWETRASRWAVRGLSLIACILVAGSGVYPVFFACYLITVASLVGFSVGWRWIRCVDGALAVTLILGLLAAQAVPKVLYDRSHGKNPVAVQREVGESVRWALSIGSMLKPTPYHQFMGLARKLLRPGTSETDTLVDRHNLLEEETRFVTLGLFASCGFLTLLAVPFLVRMPTAMSPLLGPLAKLSLAGVLLGVPGGLGYLVAAYLTPNIRAYNRISIYIAYFSTLATAFLLEYLRRRVVSPRGRLILVASLGVILVIGLADQMPRILIPDHVRARAIYAREHEFFGRVEAALPADTMVYQLPYAPFPEGYSDARNVERSYLCYEQIRPFYHSNRLRWSSPAMKGREEGVRQARLWKETPVRLVSELTRAGFGGICIDREGYDDRAETLTVSLGRLLGTKPMVSSDDRYVFFKLNGSEIPAAIGGSK